MAIRLTVVRIVIVTVRPKVESFLLLRVVPAVSDTIHLRLVKVSRLNIPRAIGSTETLQPKAHAAHSRPVRWVAAEDATISSMPPPCSPDEPEPDTGRNQHYY